MKSIENEKKTPTLERKLFYQSLFLTPKIIFNIKILNETKTILKS
jgi:hypothetical protein